MRHLVGNSEVERRFEKPMRLFEDNIEMAIKEMGFKGVNRIQRVQSRVECLLWTQ
jgi:hypothetical protein